MDNFNPDVLVAIIAAIGGLLAIWAQYRATKATQKAASAELAVEAARKYTLQAMDTVAGQYRSLIDQQDKQIDGLITDRATAEKRAEMTEQTVKKLRVELDSTLNQIADMQRTIHNLTNELMQVHRKLEKVTSELNDVRTQRDRFKTRNAQLIQENRELTARVGALERQVAILDARIGTGELMTIAEPSGSDAGNKS